MEFKKLSDVTAVDEPNESANVIIEQDGDIVRVPYTKVGGSGGGAGDILFTCEIIEDSRGDYTENIGKNGATCSHTFDEVSALLEQKALTSVTCVSYPTGFAGDCICVTSGADVRFYGYYEGEEWISELSVNGDMPISDALEKTVYIEFSSNGMYGDFQLSREGVGIYVNSE